MTTAQMTGDVSSRRQQEAAERPQNQMQAAMPENTATAHSESAAVPRAEKRFTDWASF